MNEIDLRHVDLNLLVAFDVLMAERSVTRAAERLGRTQSAVSHALTRMRGQFGDPLLVKAGGRMVASPYAVRLAQEVAPILAGIRRVLAPEPAFVAATTSRSFRVAIPDVSEALFPQLAERVRREAPGATLEWVARDERVLAAVAEGQVDVAMVPAALRLPEGVDHTAVAPLRWASFVRAGHPAIRGWGRASWSRCPHVAVRVGASMPSPVDVAIAGGEHRRRIAAWVPHFSAVAPLLARTDLIATLPVVALVDAVARYRLRALRAPIRVDPMPHRLVWSRRLANDPALRWLRAHVEAVVREVLAASDAAAP